MTLPVAPLVLPADLVGQPNGQLRSTLLTPAGIPGRDWMMHHLASRSMKAMCAALKRAGFQPRATGTYRTLDRQIVLFVSRYEQIEYTTWLLTPSERRKRWADASKHGYRSQWWRKKLINGSYPATAATPGTSNHGLGLAVDLAEERDGDITPESVSSAMVRWLTVNAATFGYSAELQSEPWHWRYVAGDRIPAATLEYERGSVDGMPAPIIREGSTGQNVVYLQNHLKWWGLYPYNIDGKAGPMTIAGLKQLQTKIGVAPTGIYDSTSAIAYQRYLASLMGS